MAESIWNNNYLLSNLDAQKLYAQSPLTTGVSGTSAYIGLEPSARYNETVLWSGTALSGECSLTENWDNFKKLQFDYSLKDGWTTAARPHGTSIISTETFPNMMANLLLIWKTSNGTVSYRTMDIGATQGTNVISATNNSIVSIASNGSVTNTTGDQLVLRKIIGINHK